MNKNFQEKLLGPSKFGIQIYITFNIFSLKQNSKLYLELYLEYFGDFSEIQLYKCIVKTCAFTERVIFDLTIEKLM